MEQYKLYVKKYNFDIDSLSKKNTYNVYVRVGESVYYGNTSEIPDFSPVLDLTPITFTAKFNTADINMSSLIPLTFCEAYPFVLFKQNGVEITKKVDVYIDSATIEPSTEVSGPRKLYTPVLTGTDLFTGELFKTGPDTDCFRSINSIKHLRNILHIKKKLNRINGVAAFDRMYIFKIEGKMYSSYAILKNEDCPKYSFFSGVDTLVKYPYYLDNATIAGKDSVVKVIEYVLGLGGPICQINRDVRNPEPPEYNILRGDKVAEIGTSAVFKFKYPSKKELLEEKGLNIRKMSDITNNLKPVTRRGLIQDILEFRHVVRTILHGEEVFNLRHLKDVLSRYQRMLLTKSLNPIKESLETIYPGRWELKMDAKTAGFTIMLHFPELTITSNKEKIEHTIYDLYVVLNLDVSKLINIKGFRTSITEQELKCDFGHSYLPRLSTEPETFCLGGSDLSVNIGIFNADERPITEKIDDFEYLLMLLEIYLTSEGGSPHRRIFDLLSRNYKHLRHTAESALILNKLIQEKDLLYKILNDYPTTRLLLSDLAADDAMFRLAKFLPESLTGYKIGSRVVVPINNEENDHDDYDFDDDDELNEEEMEEQLDYLIGNTNYWFRGEQLKIKIVDKFKNTKNEQLFSEENKCVIPATYRRIQDAIKKLTKRARARKLLEELEKSRHKREGNHTYTFIS